MDREAWQLWRLWWWWFSLTLSTPWPVAHQASLSMGFPRQEYWSGLPIPLQVVFFIAGRFFTAEPLGIPCYVEIVVKVSVAKQNNSFARQTIAFRYDFLNFLISLWACPATPRRQTHGILSIVQRRFLCASLMVSHKFSSVAQSYPTLCDPMDCSTPGFLVQHQLPELAQTHVHQVSDAIQPSHPLAFLSPPAFSISQRLGSNKRMFSVKNINERGFPGSLVVKTPRFQCFQGRKCGFNPWLGNLDLTCRVGWQKINK